MKIQCFLEMLVISVAAPQRWNAKTFPIWICGGL